MTYAVTGQAGSAIGGAVAALGVTIANVLDDVGGQIPNFGAAGVVVATAAWAMRINTKTSKAASDVRAKASQEAIDSYKTLIEDLREENSTLREEITQLKVSDAKD
jgi:predicted trehalose synthase